MSVSDSLQSGRVSLVVPCYNVEPYIGQFLDSILGQSYRSLEVILVNDGATDGTRRVISDYETRLQDAGFLLKIIDQENRGLAGAVNAGLKQFTGEYLMWPDPDDWLTPNSVESRVQLLQNNPHAGLLRSNCRKYSENEGQPIGSLMPEDDQVRTVQGLFWDILLRRTFMAPVSSTVRSSCFLEVNPDRTIFESRRASQNFQMLLPLIQKFPVIETGSILAVYRVRDDSRSRVASRTAAKLLQRQRTIREVLLATLNRLSQPIDGLEVELQRHYSANHFLPLMYQMGDFAQLRSELALAQLGFLRQAVAWLLVGFRHISGSESSRVTRRLLRLFSNVVKYELIGPESVVHVNGEKE